MNRKTKAITCVLIGHSNILHSCFGYVHCGRCDDQIGDTLGSVYQNKDAAWESCGCKECHDNLAKMGIRDKLFVPKKLIRSVLRTEAEVKKERDEAFRSLEESLKTMRVKRETLD
jgi:hypothetical protein